MRSRTLVFLTWSVLGACRAGSGAPAGSGDKHEHKFPAVVGAFHDVMAPLWHADEGAKRVDDTCSAVSAFLTQAEQVIAAPVPAEAASQDAAWKAAAGQLKAAVAALQAGCAATGRPDFAAQFHAVHEAFHHLIALLRGGVGQNGRRPRASRPSFARAGARAELDDELTFLATAFRRSLRALD